MTPEIKNCAIYTRKSTEEGLDQDFNTLDAQRESCEAYITSQKAEGWKIVKTQYNDGGYSGGNMQRPGLKTLLKDIKAGKVQTVVVYKIDRLTRSLMDFSKLVEVFDEHDVTFVSVTQSFNTTTSMGRLTLNVLLSFAQFEREVTGERIRDKIAASKKKGMWMGGFPPLGYQRLDKKLIPHPKEKQDVEYIFRQYLKLGSVRKLAKDLHKNVYRTPVRVSKKDRKYGGCVYSRGHLYKILSNPVYIGQVRHKDKIYDGQHAGIILIELYEQVQQQLKTQSPDNKKQTIPSGSLLKGLLYDCDGVIYSPTYTSKKGNRYSYYISQNLIQYRDHPKGIMARIPAHEIEKTVTNSIKGWVQNLDQWQSAFPNTQEQHLSWVMQNLIPIRSNFIRDIVNKIMVNEDTLEIKMNAKSLRENIEKYSEISIADPAEKEIIISAPFKINRGKNGAIIIENKNDKNKDPFNLPADRLKRIVRGIVWRDEHFAGETITSIGKRTAHGENYVNNCIQESFRFLSQ